MIHSTYTLKMYACYLVFAFKCMASWSYSKVSEYQWLVLDCQSWRLMMSSTRLHVMSSSIDQNWSKKKSIFFSIILNRMKNFWIPFNCGYMLNHKMQCMRTILCFDSACCWWFVLAYWRIFWNPHGENEWIPEASLLWKVSSHCCALLKQQNC